MLELFITGETDSKSLITAGLAATMQGLDYSVGVYKPIQMNVFDDNGNFISKELKNIKNIDSNVETFGTYLYKTCDIPFKVAENENLPIDISKIFTNFNQVKNNFDCIILEGTQGLATPLGCDFLECNLVKKLNIPVIIVLSVKENFVNNAIMQINLANSSDIEVRGIILTDCDKNDDIMDNCKLIEKFTNVKILGITPKFDDDINPNDLIDVILTCFNLQDIFKVKIEKLEQD